MHAYGKSPNLIWYGASIVLTLLALVQPAAAHWCDDLWISSYNIVVRPESDTLLVPPSGTATTTLYVQNNMGYQLPNFELVARMGSATVQALRQTQTVPGILLPGEKAKYLLTLTVPGGGRIKTDDISFSVAFGSGQGTCYPTAGADAVVRVKPDGSIFPRAPLPGLDKPQKPAGCIFDLPQGLALQYQAMADFEDVDVGLDKLLQLYCAGRGSWNAGGGGVAPRFCPSTSATLCPTRRPPAGTGEKYAFSRLWAAGDLAARKAALGPRLPVLRERLMCAVNDDDLTFAGYALFVLGYLGEDAAARAFTATLAEAGGELGTIAKAALLMMVPAAEKAAFRADVRAGLSHGGFFARMACAAALGIVDKDDAAVTSVLMPGLSWTRPDGKKGDGGKGLFAAHLLSMVAWDRRGWAKDGADTGDISFYGKALVVAAQSADVPDGELKQPSKPDTGTHGARGWATSKGLLLGGACVLIAAGVLAAIRKARRRTRGRP